MFIPIYLRLVGNVPPPKGWKSWTQVKVTFCFWLMYPPPQEWKSWIQVKVTFWFWLMYPPPKIEIGLNMNAIGKKSFQERWSSTFYQSTPPPPFHYHYLILCLNRKLVNFNFKWIYGLKPHPPPLSSQKKIKCSFLDYVQLLMIGRAGQWTRTPSTTPLQPKK